MAPHLKHLFWHCEFCRHIFRYLFRSFFLEMSIFLHILKLFSHMSARFLAHVGAFLNMSAFVFAHLAFLCTFRRVFCTFWYFVFRKWAKRAPTCAKTVLTYTVWVRFFLHTFRRNDTTSTQICLKSFANVK